MTGRRAVVETLVAAGADLEMHNTTDGWTALHYAAAYGRDEIVAKLLSSGADKNALDNDGSTPLMTAATKGRGAAVEALVAAGTDLEMHSTTDGWTALHFAVYYGHGEIVAALLSSGADKNALDGEGTTPLMWAAGNNRLVAAEKLLAAGAYLHMHNGADGCTALHQAASHGHDEVVAALLLNGADKNAISDNGRTPLMMAAASPYCC